MSDRNNSSPAPASRARRWWPAAVIIAAVVAALLWFWWLRPPAGPEDPDLRRRQVFLTLAVIALGDLALLGWTLFLSALPKGRRLSLAAGLLALVVALPIFVRLRGFTGDVVPILELRWSAPARPEPVALESEPASGGEAGSRAGTEAGSGAEAIRVKLPESPQFRGAERTGVIRGVRLARDWSVRPPRLLWKRPAGAGWSSAAVAAGLAITEMQEGEDELVVAFGLLDGRPRWIHRDRASFRSTISGDGPRSTPTVAAGAVFTLGATGHLARLDLHTGAVRWHRDIVAEAGAEVPAWGKSCSPLVLEGKVIVSAGGPDDQSLVAYDATSGERVWAGGSDRSGYASPLLATLGGERQVVIFNRASVAGHDPETGRLLWSFPWPAGHPNVAMPIALGEDRLLVTSGYGVGAKSIRLSRREGGGFEAAAEWETRALRAKFTNPVLAGGFVYGLDEGILVCLDPSDGRRRWKAGRYGHGQTLLAGDLILVSTDRGEIVLVEPSPEAHRELARFKLLEGRTWAVPALAGPYLVVRSDRELAVYELPRVEGSETSAAEASGEEEGQGGERKM